LKVVTLFYSFTDGRRLGQRGQCTVQPELKAILSNWNELDSVHARFLAGQNRLWKGNHKGTV